MEIFLPAPAAIPGFIRRAAPFEVNETESDMITWSCLPQIEGDQVCRGERLMTNRWLLSGLVFVIVLSVTAGALAQGVQTGTLTGTVKDTDGLVLPGVTVSVKSTALQGTQTAVTDGNGIYMLRGLPPGTYSTTFELASFSTVNQRTSVPLGGTANVDVVLPRSARESAPVSFRRRCVRHARRSHRSRGQAR